MKPLFYGIILSLILVAVLLLCEAYGQSYCTGDHVYCAQNEQQRQQQYYQQQNTYQQQQNRLQYENNLQQQQQQRKQYWDDYNRRYGID